MPLFESVTPEIILERILSRMETELQTREGSYAYDQAAPISFEIWRVLMTLDELIEAFYVNENSGPYLDAHARLFAMSRREGARAAVKMNFEGQDGTVVPSGSLFYAAGALEFRLTADVTIKDGAGTGYLLAAEVGTRYNVPAGSIDQIGRSVPGLEKFENEDAQGGADPESDGDLYARLDEKRKRPPTSGNEAHYKEWALSVNGVGAVRVTPLWKGPGTVLVLIAGFDRRPVDDAIVADCAEYIQTQRPVGADVTVASAVAVEVDVAARVVLTSTASLPAVEAAFTALLDEYLADTAFEEFTVYATRVGALLMSVDGVLDYEGLTLNGSGENLVLEQNGVPVRGRVDLT